MELSERRASNYLMTDHLAYKAGSLWESRKRKDPSRPAEVLKYIGRPLMTGCHPVVESKT